jgi:hypothetical protein
MIEAVHIPEKEYNGGTIVVSQPINQRQGLPTPVVQTLEDVQQLPSPSTTPQARNTPDPHGTPDPCGTPDPRGTPPLDGHHQSPSLDPVDQQILQELSASRTTPQTTPGG